MKTRFSTIDLAASLAELQKILHMRIVNVYDIDHKTYLFKLSRQEEKCVLLVESGNRIHRTDYEWPKNPAPSGFTMKMRKHIHNKRLEEIRQLGIDRIVDLQFGSNEAAYHVIVELYDRGNIVLTDYEYTIVNVLRPRTENEVVRFVVHEKYQIDRAKQREPVLTLEKLREILLTAKEGDNLRRVLNPHLEYGPALIDHVLLGSGFPDGAKIGKGFNINEDLPRLVIALEEADEVLSSALRGDCKGIITQKAEKRNQKDANADAYLVYNEFHPFLYRQFEKLSYVEFPSFNKGVDEFFSQIESQKLDLKTIQQEKDALKKLENVKKDHETRIGSLQKNQEQDKFKAELIEMNLPLVEKAILVVQSAIANQLDWKEISLLIQEATQQGDPVAKSIKGLKLEINNMTLLLQNQYDSDEDNELSKPQLIDIDLDLSAYANAKKYYDKKKHAMKKEQKTIESSTKAYKSAEKKMKQTLKEVATVASINKARKTHWFEKFLWFVSSENYLVIGGRDQQQNEIIVKRYLKSNDLYVHADLHGASSIVVKNPTGQEIPPKTLNEAGTMAVCSSAAWDSKVVTSAWWVRSEQVSKTAPTGEYLTVGSFMIRGKKNYLPPCYLIMGFGFLFRLDDESVPNHKDERRVKSATEDAAADDTSEIENDVEINLDDDEDDDDGDIEKKQDDENVDEKVESTNNLTTIEELPVEDINSKQVDDESDEDDDMQDGEKIAFPDTIIDLEHIQGDRFHAKPRNTSVPSEDVIYLGDSEPVLVKPSTSKKVQPASSKTKSTNQIETKNTKNENEKKVAGNNQPQQLKRGQKYKLKKMKEKYKNQDEEERALAMSLLQASSGKEKKSKRLKEQAAKGKKDPQKPKVKQPPAVHLHSEGMTAVKGDEEEGSDDENELKQQTEENARLLNCLTGIPIPEDTLLYAVPVCAPYNSIMSYKYKVKLTPGSGKRGKAAKTALSMFLHDKAATAREKDLFRSVKDQDISRNLPGKIKLSAPQLLRQKKR